MKPDGNTYLSTASVEITPQSPISLSGYAGRTEPYTNVASELEANLLYFCQGNDRTVLIQIDTLFPSLELKNAISKVVDAPCEVLIVASHTHYAPSLDPQKPMLGRVSAEYFAEVVDKISTSINAIADRGKTCGRFKAKTTVCAQGISRRLRALSVNTRFPFVKYEVAIIPNSQENIDTSLRTFSFLDADDGTEAVIWSWACHPVGIPHSEGLNVSSHYIGYVRDRLRKLFGRKVAVLFLPGFMGDIRPNFCTKRPKLSQRLRNPLTKDYFAIPTSEVYENFCRAVGDSTIAAISAHDAELYPLEVKRVKRDWIPLSELFTDAQNRSLPIADLSLNDEISFLFVGAEVSNGYASGQESSLRPGVVPVGYFEEVFGYLPTDRQIREGGYEVNGFQHAFGVRGQMRDELQQRFYNRIRGLYDKIKTTPCE